MTYSFDVVVIGILHEAAIVVSCVFRPETGLTVVAPAGGQGGSVERSHGGAVFRGSGLPFPGVTGCNTLISTGGV